MAHEKEEKRSADARNSLQAAVNRVKAAAGSRMLTDEEILLLLADSIEHSYTYEENGYQ